KPFPETELGGWQVSTGGGQAPLWARNSRALFYRGNDGALIGLRWNAAGRRFDPRPPVKLVEGRQLIPGGFRMYDVRADGSRFLMVKEAGDQTTATSDVIVVVQNWVEELKRLLPRN